MTTSLPPLPRAALHLLLALSVLLQAATAVAMRTGMAVGAADAAGETAAIASTPEMPQAEERVRPPCHGATLDAAPGLVGAKKDATSGADVGASCCGEESGGICEWACAQVVPLASPIVTVGLTPSTGTRAADPRSGPLGTPLPLLLRPPIG